MSLTHIRPSKMKSINSWILQSAQYTFAGLKICHLIALVCYIYKPCYQSCSYLNIIFKTPIVVLHYPLPFLNHPEALLWQLNKQFCARMREELQCWERFLKIAAITAHLIQRLEFSGKAPYQSW